MLYYSLLKKIFGHLVKYRNKFAVAFLNGKLTYPLLKIFSKTTSKKIDLVITAGIHGEEQAPVVAIVQHLPEILTEAIKNQTKLIIYPCANPYGFEKKKRLNIEGKSCNAYWIHEKGIMAKESMALKKDIKQYKVKYFLSLHEEGESQEKKFYLYAFGDKQIAQHLVEIVSQKIPVFETGFKGKYGENQIKNGIIYQWHDGTFEDYMSHQGTRASICTETHLKLPLKLRIETNFLLIKTMIKISKNK